MSPPPTLLLDTGPWVALLCRDDHHHRWARDQFGLFPGPFPTCEAVVAETCFLLGRAGHRPAAALELIERGVIRVGSSLAEEVASVRALLERCANVPASLADACLVRLAELNERCLLLTLDSDFRIHRRQGRRVIPLLSPPARSA